ncbi:MAG: hypothetical protein ACI9RP_002038 [Cyclobacteriaceae bacterium]
MGDNLADQAIVVMRSNPQLREKIQQITTKEELLISDFPVELISLRQDVLDIDQVNLARLVKGQIFFKQHLLPIMTLLGFYSLPYCYAAAKGARVLIHSKNIIENPGQRLGETARFVFDCCLPNAFEEQGSGYVSIFKVRLMHAAIRFHASKHIKDEVPVNQEDLLGTFLSFSLIVLRGLDKLGITVTEAEAKDYLYLWNYIGSCLGIDSSLLPSDLKEASILEKKIRLHQFTKSEEGVKLTYALLSYFEVSNSGLPSFSPSQVMAALMGKAVAADLGLPAPSIKSDVSLSVLKTSQFLASFVKDHYQWIDDQLAVQLGHDDKKGFFHIPI